MADLLIGYSWEEKLPTAKSALEYTWLYHEIGRCHLEMNHASEAKQYGEQSLEAAVDAGEELWQLNASVLIAQCHGLQAIFSASVVFFKDISGWGLMAGLRLKVKNSGRLT